VSIVLLDTAALIALSNRTDNWHREAVRIRQVLSQQGQKLVTSEWILTEFLNGFSKPPLRQIAIQVLDRIRSSRVVQIVSSSSALWWRGQEIYRQYADKEWSLVDCISIVICSEFNVSDIFTTDHHFEQAGFNILMRER